MAARFGVCEHRRHHGTDDLTQDPKPKADSCHGSVGADVARGSGVVRQQMSTYGGQLAAERSFDDPVAAHFFRNDGRDGGAASILR